PDVTILAEPGSVRAAVVGGAGTRQVVSVSTALHVPDTAARAGASVDKVRALEIRSARTQAELAAVTRRRDAITQLVLAPRLHATLDKVDARTQDALATSAMLGALAAALDDRIAALEDTAVDLAKELEAARLADAQA